MLFAWILLRNYGVCVFFFFVPFHCFSVLFTHAVQMMKNCLAGKGRQRETGTRGKEKKKTQKISPESAPRLEGGKAGKREKENERQQLLLRLGCLCGGRERAREKLEIETEKEGDRAMMDGSLLGLPAGTACNVLCFPSLSD